MGPSATLNGTCLHGLTNVVVTTGFQRHIISNHYILDNKWFLIMLTKKAIIDNNKPIYFFAP